MAYVYDAGALIAAERDNKRMWALHRNLLAIDLEPIVPATVVAQVRRGRQVLLDRLLNGCRILPLDEAAALAVSDLLTVAGRNDLVDAHVVACCIDHGATCVTSDWKDIEHLSDSARTDRQRRFGRRKVPIIPI